MNTSRSSGGIRREEFPQRKNEQNWEFKIWNKKSSLDLDPEAGYLVAAADIVH